VRVDTRDTLKPGPKFYEWERKGVPLRIEIGPRDVAAGKVMAAFRTVGADAARKESMDDAVAVATIADRLAAFQDSLLAAAHSRREANSHRGVVEYDTFREIIEGAGGFVYAGWCGGVICEARVKDETKATIRVIPDDEFRSPEIPADCLVCGEPARHEVVWARAY
jgi:prolyl-tRNA synthetase